MSKLVVTRFENKILLAYYEDDKLTELSLSEESSVLDNIYIGKVENVVSNINACFIDYGGDDTCYYSIHDNNHIFLNGKSANSPIKAGDELLIQISRDAVKTKKPVATAALSLRGEHVVVSVGEKIGVSGKIKSGKRREELKNVAKAFLPQGMGCIIRTSMEDAENQLLISEISQLSQKLTEVMEKAKTRTCFTCLYKHNPDYLDSMLLKHIGDIEDIVTDQEDVFSEISDFLKRKNAQNVNIRLYRDDMCSLMTTYNLNKELENLKKEKVWLKSGAYLVIQQTEAMVVVDVNTGKAITNKNIDSHMLSVNIEAARETCRQLRIRNLSGIIMIDFINMKSSSDMDQIKDILQQELRKDSVPANFVDVTKLGLVEITRKKVKRPIIELLSE